MTHSRSSVVSGLALGAAAVLLAACATPPSGPSGMTFFVSSVGSGKGGDLGGANGADKLCTKLATAVGAG
ncbi:MAG: hypothetical protein ABI364_02830, partial [Caldimonas sp.]